mmetsp:Transcript_60227/g.176024  ORF Transcript_60227/g.176024 Transcript_60227/m.176024 type:complete len:96 (-) Transcript_60227:592-879(-)
MISSKLRRGKLQGSARIHDCHQDHLAILPGTLTRMPDCKAALVHSSQDHVAIIAEILRSVCKGMAINPQCCKDNLSAGSQVIIKVLQFHLATLKP